MFCCGLISADTCLHNSICHLTWNDSVGIVKISCWPVLKPIHGFVNSISHREGIPELSIILAIMELVHHCYELSWTSKFCQTFQKFVSNALVGSAKVMWQSIFCSWYFSCSCWTEKIISCSASFLKTHWFSGSCPPVFKELIQTVPRSSCKDLAVKMPKPCRFEDFFTLDNRRLVSLFPEKYETTQS